MNLDDIKGILELVREHELAEFEFEQDGLKLRVKKAGQDVVYAAPPMTMAAAPAPVAMASGTTPIRNPVRRW